MPAVEPRLEHRAVQTYCALPVEVTMASIGEAISEAIDHLGVYLASRGISPTGPALVRYRTVTMDAPFVIEVGWAVDDGPWIEAPYVADVLPAGQYAVAAHDGPYAELGSTTAALLAWGERHGVAFSVARTPEGDTWECWYEWYIGDPVPGPDGLAGTADVCLLTRAD